MMSGRLACKASRLLGGATPHLSRSTLAAATSGAATAVPSVVAAPTRLVLPFASINAAPFSAAATSTGERPSLGPAGPGRTTNGKPLPLLAGAIAAFLSTTLTTSGGVASCEGPELKPEEEWPETEAVELWKKKRSDWPTTWAGICACVEKHGGVTADYVSFNGTPMSAISHAALLKNIDKLTGRQAKSALLGNGWKQNGKADEVKQRLRGCLDGTNIVAGYSNKEGGRSEFMKAKSDELKAAGLPMTRDHKAWCDDRGGTYLHRIGLKSLTNKAMVEFRPKLLIIHGGPADPRKPNTSNIEQLARDLEIPLLGAHSPASSLKRILQHDYGLKLHPKSKEFDGYYRNRRSNIVATGIKPAWDMYPQVFCHEHLHPGRLPTFYQNEPLPALLTTASKPSTASAKSGRAQRAQKRARSAVSKSSAPIAGKKKAAPKKKSAKTNTTAKKRARNVAPMSSAPPAKKARRQRKRFGDEGDSDDESYCA